MDLTAEREREQAAAQAAPQPEPPAPRKLTRAELDAAIIAYRMPAAIEFTGEQAEIIALTEHHIQDALRTLDMLSTPEQRYGPSQDIERVALLNGIANLLVEKGLLTPAEVYVAKREAIAEQMDVVVMQAREHRAQNSSKLVVPGDHRGPGGRS